MAPRTSHRSPRRYLPAMLLFLFFVLLAQRGRAGPISWGNAVLTTNLTSAGDPIDDTWIFELGAFASGFTPSSANTALWAANWTLAKRSTYVIRPLDGSVPTNQFGGEYILPNNNPPFATNRSGYIWGHNCSVANGQWILITDTSWKWPLVNNINPDTTAWRVEAANNIILGQTNGVGFGMKMAAVINSPLPTISPTDWKSLQFNPIELLNPVISDWNADPDLDQMSNLMEYAMGRDPLLPNRLWSPTLSWHTEGANKFLKLSAPRCGYSQATTTIEVSSNLTGWSSAPANVETLISTSDLLEARDLTAVSASDKRFIRLKISVP